MIKFSNGYKFDFGCASGAMAFDGKGWWIHKPYRFLGLLRSDEFTIITKTLTYMSIKGNYKWYKPWESIKLHKNGIYNRVGLTNPGYSWWIGEVYNKILKPINKKVIVSILPKTYTEASLMALNFNELNNIIALQINLSCPNVEPISSIDSVVNGVLDNSKHPIILKLGWKDRHLVKKFDNSGVEAFELINSVDGYSGRIIQPFARRALMEIKDMGLKMPVISGGGIDSLEEVYCREELGAKGFVFGSLFITKPWLPNKIITQYRKNQICQKMFV